MSTQISDTTQNDVQQNPVETFRRAASEELYGLPVDTSIAFSNRKGLYNRSIEKRQRKFLKKLCFLGPFLEENERILFVTTGCSPTSFVEQLLTGAPLHPLKRSLFVLTDRRILHIPTTITLRYRHSVAQFPYADCRQLRIKGSTLIAKYKSGRTERFPCIAFRGRSKVKAILKSVSLEGRASPLFERSHLCPSCTSPLIKNYYACPQCSLKFKNKGWATILSIIFPGGGYFYTRHPFLGVFAGAMEAVFVLLLVVALSLFSISFPNVPQGLYQAIMVCVTVLVLEKLTTAMFSGKCIAEFIPKKKHVEVRTDLLEAQHSQPKPEEMLSTGWRSR
jgi:hypothetical protein